jgi:hypothetical protein
VIDETLLSVISHWLCEKEPRPQFDHRAGRPAHPSLSHRRDRQRQLPFQVKFHQDQEGGENEKTGCILSHTSGSTGWVNIKCKTRVSFRRVNSTRKCNFTERSGRRAAVASLPLQPPSQRSTDEKLHAARQRGTIPNLHFALSRILPEQDCQPVEAQ